ncbi:MAG: prepilin-type N-terminal cleavage/methylation domain-containing protein [Nitrospirota bacterium]
MKEKGFTLIELMVGIAMVGVVTTAIYQFYIDTFFFQANQDRRKDMQVRLQLAMDILVSDIRAAGFGTIDPLDSGVSKGYFRCAGVLPDVRIALGGFCIPVAPINSNDGPDGLIISGAKQFVGTLEAGANPGISASTIVVTPPGGTQLIEGGNLITIGGFFTSAVGAVADNAVTLNTSLPPDQVYPPGIGVFTVQSLLYSIGPSNLANAPGPALLAAPAGGGPPVVIATGIEDLQVSYLLNNQNPAVGPIAVDTPVDGNGFFPESKLGYLAMRVSLVATMPDGNPDYKSGKPPLLLEDRSRAGEAPGRLRRMVLTRVVELVNDGCGPNDPRC